MLKARKRITKKEIKHDPFLESIYQTKEYFEKNVKTITRAGIGLVAVLIVVFILNKNLNAERNDSEAALGKAIVNLGIGDRDNGLLQLELLIDDYSGSDAAQRGSFMLARLFYEQKDFLTAESYLLDFLDDPTKEFHTGALMMMAELEKINGNTSSEEDYLKEAIKNASTDSEKDKFSLVLAEHFMRSGNYVDARELSESIYNKYDKNSNLYNKSEEILGHLHTFSSDEQ